MGEKKDKKPQISVLSKFPQKFKQKSKKTFFKNPKIKKYFVIFILFLVILFCLIVIIRMKIVEMDILCGDGTLNNVCSLRKPYVCSNKSLVERASVCGCPEGLTIQGDSCFSIYQTNPKSITLDYILRGEKRQLDFVVYKGLVDYLSDLSKSIYYGGKLKPTRRDFKIKNINEIEQRNLILPLVTKIQNLTQDKEDQVRIAVSLVQNIDYGDSGKTMNLQNGNNIIHSRYPYEVLYDVEGICEAKSELLAFLLSEIGYSVVLFYYPAENHEAVGIKCPVEYSLNNSGYCFIETTGPSIISNYQDYYIGWGKLSSNPEIIPISEGISLDKNLYEYKDVRSLIKINEAIEEKGQINIFQRSKLKNLMEKYGLIDIYNSV
ncbi:hypothetical protein KAR52_02500 [Candidatus Pacearchaeota archaeon]|nr:hypothetical protein [Candidatus Pacearchaeota archaeon]